MTWICGILHPIFIPYGQPLLIPYLACPRHRIAWMSQSATSCYTHVARYLVHYYLCSEAMSHRSSSSTDQRVSSSGADGNAPEAGGEHTVLAPPLQQMPALKPEVIIEIPPPSSRRRRFAWLGAGVALLVIVLIAISALTIRTQGAATVSLEATVDALVALRLTADRSARPQGTATASLEATVDAPVALRLTEEWSARPPQPTATESEAVEPTSSPLTDHAETEPVPDETEPVPDESASVFGQSSVVLNLRRGPSTQYPVLRLIPVGERLQLLGRTTDSGWFFISFVPSPGADENTGWVAAWLVDIPGDPNRLAIVPHPPLPAQSEQQP